MTVSQSLAPSLSLRDQLKALENLQELDLKIDSLQKEKLGLPALLQQAQEAHAKAQKQFQDKTNLVIELEKLVKQSIAALELNQDRLERTTSKLSSVHNSKEYSAANSEVAQLQKLSLTFEGQKLKAQTDIQTAQKDLETLTAQVESLKSALEIKSKEVGAKEADIDSKLLEIAAVRTEKSAGVDRQLMARYNRIRVHRAGMGIVPAVGGRCSGCNMFLPPQLFNEIQKLKEVHDCPSCHRVLYLPDPAPKS